MKAFREDQFVALALATTLVSQIATVTAQVRDDNPGGRSASDDGRHGSTATPIKHVDRAHRREPDLRQRVSRRMCRGMDHQRVANLLVARHCERRTDRRVRMLAAARSFRSERNQPGEVTSSTRTR